MAAEKILSLNQQKLLSIISREKKLCNFFYLTGGTALAEFYLHHRLSEDLDFFAEKEFDPQIIFVFWKKAQKKAGIKKIDFQQSFNRNLFFLHIGKEIIKTEFTYFPFPRIESKKKIGDLAVDSLLDIAVNKLFTIYQKSRSRDFIDLFFILKKENWTIADLIKKAKIKFDWHVDAMQLGAQFLQATIVKDYPRMIKKIDHQIWQKFFLKEAKRLNSEVLKK
ncbi:MAG: nucleotidyl transferase AbiEii/AbiGii toxin family protein [Candidatus Magasanikbacteria bacterium]|nr:nucleotidyl transferase AbiEii/AbiGii toxin family protein [Candidatus Magasanikbacteria bacterium]